MLQKNKSTHCISHEFTSELSSTKSKGISSSVPLLYAPYQPQLRASWLLLATASKGGGARGAFSHSHQTSFICITVVPKQSSLQKKKKKVCLFLLRNTEHFSSHFLRLLHLLSLKFTFFKGEIQNISYIYSDLIKCPSMMK